MSNKSTSKYISLILRHKPEIIGITLDEHGWAKDDELINGVSKTHPLDMEILERIVAEDGYIFYRSVNGVWLIKSVPARYMEKITGNR